MTSSSAGISHITYTNRTTEQCQSTNSESKSDGPTNTEKRLWLGNLDPKLTEFQLLKLVQKYGTIEHFDFLFHRSGPHIGLPRGYAFVEFEDRSSAESCMTSLDGRKILERYMAIRWAHQVVKDYPDEQTKLRAKLPALAIKESDGCGPSSGLNKERAINAIEAKLKAMERDKTQQDFALINQNTSSIKKTTQNSSHRPSVQRARQPYQHQSQSYQSSRTSDRHRKPYSR